MPTDHRTQVDELVAEYRRNRERLAGTRRDLAAVTATASSDDGRVRVVVGPRGELTDLVLADDVRMRPAELAATIVRLSVEAARAAAERSADVLAEVLPAGTDPELLLGPPPEAVPRNETRPADDEVEDEDFSDASWLQQGPTGRT
ncbi:YbaB/EbfC family nucleoid-associated protein [Saccharopolyspora mangrovi]|uniref:YbaB/EbfC family nucleoid-associated protein n=1 Tax=Saccharopolyspora mangrovi TaxID=3082379 RepID=A0ABU6A9H0_9PSEU|nr:YbaB/EbfC family nucleoid-associated protein [Saccharopolyspora sp. S2-29]MEB3368131.1 YbaB/EbfC family nucleoid-associated protein [Saccharopolyspora sp. S2-29]